MAGTRVRISGVVLIAAGVAACLFGRDQGVILAIGVVVVLAGLAFFVFERRRP